MRATPAKVISIFEPTHRYVVPIFQRHYVWNQTDQWEPLWLDIQEKIAEKKLGKSVAPHFLGAVILDSTRRNTTKEVSRFLVIDGQQRLTTLQILLTAIRDVSEYYNLNSVSKLIERCLYNSDTELMENPEHEVFKLWPTQVNRETFCKIINAKSYSEIQNIFPLEYGTTKTGRKQKHPKPRERLVEAYEYFYGQIILYCEGALHENERSDELMALIGVLKDDFTLVEIILDEGDDSQEIFNSLNGRGKPLSQSDLLRSYIFMRAEKAVDNRDKFYKIYWSRFEDQWWDFEVIRGNQISSRLDLLTRTILSAKLGMPIDVRRVHTSYRGWIDRLKPFDTLEEELCHFGKYADAFEQLNGKVNGELSNFGKKMAAWETSTVNPLICFLYAESNMPEEQLMRCLDLIESFIVRRSVCGLNNKEYNKFFVELVAKIRNSDDIYSSISRELKHSDSETRRFPSDDEFKAAWISKPFYNRLKSDQLIQLFIRIEASFRSGRAEHNQISLASVEHIMPQDWTQNYSIDGVNVPKAMNSDWFVPSTDQEKDLYENLKSEVLKRRSLIHTIGNLTAVTQPLNSAMRNAKYLDKKKYLRESVLSINRYFESISDWNEPEINSRANLLFSHAVKIW